MAVQVLPYCGTPPAPGELIARFNTDPVLIACLSALIILHLRLCAAEPGKSGQALIGWIVAAAAFMSPLCALSVSLFSARVAQHMILILVAAPLIAESLPRSWRFAPWPPVCAFMACLWFWHMPIPYDATFRSTALYWSMHISLFGSAIWLWRPLLVHDAQDTARILVAGTISSIQMGLLGAVLTLSSRPMFLPHYFTTEAWGFTPMVDQQLGGALMWVPGCLLFLWVALRSCATLWRALEPAPAA